MLKNNIELIHEETISSLLKLALHEHTVGEYPSSENVVRQTLLMKYIANLINQRENDTKKCIELFFYRLRSNQLYRQQFDKDLNIFHGDIIERGCKIDNDIEKEEKNKELLNAGSLDPKIVMKSLPEELKICFKTQDAAKLQVALLKMPRKDATDHLNRCLRSGLLKATPKSLDNQERTNDVEEKITEQ